VKHGRAIESSPSGGSLENLEKVTRQGEYAAVLVRGFSVVRRQKNWAKLSRRAPTSDGDPTGTGSGRQCREETESSTKEGEQTLLQIDVVATKKVDLRGPQAVERE
jgi:hypothetical protein